MATLDCEQPAWQSSVGSPGRGASFTRNAQAYVHRKDMLTEVAADMRTIFDAPDRTTAETYLAKAVEKYSKTASRLSEWLTSNIPEGLTCFAFPAVFRKLLRTTNGV
jgi:putative transposase